MLRSTTERWIKFIQYSSYLSEIIENSYMINPQTPYQIKSYFPESSLQKLKPFFGQIFFEDLDFSQVPFVLFQPYSPALNLPQILEILDPPNKKDL